MIEEGEQTILPITIVAYEKNSGSRQRSWDESMTHWMTESTIYEYVRADVFHMNVENLKLALHLAMDHVTCDVVRSNLQRVLDDHTGLKSS